MKYGPPEEYRERKTEAFGRKHVPVTLHPPQTPYALARDYTMASSVTRWPLHVCGVVNLNTIVHQPITKISATATKGYVPLGSSSISRRFEKSGYVYLRVREYLPNDKRNTPAAFYPRGVTLCR
jgi:hypothetical protein